MDGVSVKEVFHQRRTNQDVRKGIDWNPRLGADVFRFYGSGPCKTSPLRSEDFYRAVTVSPYGRANVDLSQPGFHDDGKAHWRTPCCAKKWTWSDDSNSRLFVVGATPASPSFALAKYTYIGKDHSQQAESTINFLRGCQLAKPMGNMEHTGTSVLQVIAMIADHVEKRLRCLPEVEEIRCVDLKNANDNYGYIWTIVCEDSRLSVPFVGKSIRVLNVKLATEAPEVLPLGEFDLLLAICAASLDIERVQPNEGTSFKRIRKRFLYDATYKKARDAFGRLSVVANHIQPPWRVAVPDDDDDESL